MARAALYCSQADIAVSVTGVAGPEPDEHGNPVGLVYLAWRAKGWQVHRCEASIWRYRPLTSSLYGGNGSTRLDRLSGGKCVKATIYPNPSSLSSALLIAFVALDSLKDWQARSCGPTIRFDDLARDFLNCSFSAACAWLSTLL
jgi:hypothetical protein